MRFETFVPVLAGEAMPDPVTNPGDVEERRQWHLARRQNDSTDLGSRLLIALEGAAGETVTLDMWALDEATDPNPNADQITPAQMAARRWYRFAAGVLVTANMLATVASSPAGGKVYARRTADTIAAMTTRRLLCTCV